MSKRKRIGLLLSLLLIAAALVFFATRSREPVYQGKNLNAWLDDYDPVNPSQQSSAELQFALRQMGTNTLPFLLSRLHSKDSFARLAIEGWIGRQDVLHIRFHDNDRDRHAAADAFFLLGPMAKPAMPALVEMLHDSNTCFVAAQILGAIGPDAIAALTNTWTHSNPDIRMAGFKALVDMGTNAETALPFLIAALQDTNSDFRRVAAVSMFYVGSNQPALAIPALIKALNDPDQKVKDTAIRPLGKFASKAQAAVPKLTELLGHRESSGSAAVALVRIIGTNQSIPFLTKALTNEDDRVQVILINILGTFQSEAREAIPDLLPFVRIEDEQLRCTAIQALIKIGAEPDVMVPILVKELEDADSMIRWDVLSALAAFGPKAKSAEPILLEQIKVINKSEVRLPLPMNTRGFDAERYGQALGPNSSAPSDSVSPEFETLEKINPAAAGKIKEQLEKEKSEATKAKK